MPKRPDNLAWRYWRTVFGVVAAGAVLVIGGLTGHVTRADNLNCSVVKCVALTFDDGPGPYTDRLLQILKDNDAKATFFLIGNKVAANPAGAEAHRGRRYGDRQPHLGTPQHGDDPSRGHRRASFPGPTTRLPPQPDARRRCTVPPADCPTTRCARPPAKFGLAEILWDVIPFDWANDSNTAATRYMLMTQIKPGSVVLFHDTYSSTVDLVYQFIPVLKANGYHLVTVSELLGPRAPGSSYGSRENGPPVNELHDIPPGEIPTLPKTPSPKPMPNFPITDIPGQNSGGPNNGA